MVVSASIEPEAFGRVSVEAQSMEIPIIASDIGGSKETILKDKSGLFFKSGDPISLVEIFQEPQLKKTYANYTPMTGIEI